MSKELKQLQKLNLKLPFELEEVHPDCHSCILKQIKKYEKAIDKDSKSTANRFLVPCTGIPLYPIDPTLKPNFDDDTWEELEAIADIVKWASKYLKLPDGTPWDARWYQKQVLRCSSTRKMLRIARRCMVPGTPVLMADGSWKPIETIKIGEEVASRNKKNQLVNKKVILEHDNGIQDVFKVTLSNNMSVTCTENHPFLVLNPLSKGFSLDWKSIEDGLSVGTKVKVIKHYDQWGKKHNPNLGALLGYMLTDGYFGRKGQTPKFTNNNEVMLREVSWLAYHLFGFVCPSREKGNGYDVYLTDSNKKTKNTFTELTKELGLYGIKANRKTIPQKILRDYDKETLLCLINRMISGDGWVGLYSDKKSFRPEIGLCSASKEMLEQVRLVLLKLDIVGYLKEETRVTNKSNGRLSTLYKYIINDARSIQHFFKEVGYIKGKEEKSKAVEDCALSKQRLRRVGEKQFRYVTIKSIEPAGQSQTYDIGLEDNSEHNFVSDGIVVHNTGKTDLVCIEICYYLFTNEKIKIVVAGPQKTHTEEIITRVRAFIQSNPELAKCVTRDVSAPYYELKLSNGSRLRGFAAGAKGKGGEGVSIRGQDADRLYLEEMDYVDERAITGAVLPLLATSPNTSLIGFSTPSGMRTPYYKFCEENPYYKEFQYNYRVLDHWKLIEMEKSNYTEENWTHEYLAEWGTSEAGVYKPSYIDRALKQYKYSDHKPTPGWKYCIGTDWNEKHGTEIITVGYSQFSTVFHVVDSLHIERSEFTQLEGVRALLGMVKKWRPEFVYIDAGNGSTNYELLRKTAHKESIAGGDRDIAKLLHTLKKYDSGASIETRDPITKQKTRKPAKSFMINASVRMFELNKIVISSQDMVLEKQLRNYIIERYTPNGNPVYGLNEQRIGDHRLDALNLALVAFHLEFDDLHKINNYCTSVDAVPDPRAIKMAEIRNKDISNASGNSPSDRRLEGNIRKTPSEDLVFPSVPARLDDPNNNIKTNRLGWDTDQEGIRMEEFLQRKRANRGGNDRPQRTNF